MTPFTPPAEPRVADVVAALRSSPGPIIMSANRAADYLEAIHRAVVVAEQLLQQGRAHDATLALRCVLEVVGK